MLSPSSLASVFPDADAFARAFFEEGVRHLSDARVLHQKSRHASSVTSSMKAAELGIKSVLILEGAMGVYEKVFNTHKPLTEIEKHPLLKRLNPLLEAHRADLSLNVREMESLEPTQFGKGNYDPAAGEANTEYPFLVKTLDASGNTVARLQSPQTYFDNAQSLRYYRLAHELLVALPLLYPDMKKWRVSLPRKM